MEIDTPQGPARAHVHDAEGSRALLVLGHGAGGSTSAPDLTAARDAALASNVRVALVEQPYRVAGRRSPPRAPRLDEAWIAVIEALDPDLPLVAGGRSSGARVACRTAAATNAVGVLCLAFPLIPPRGEAYTRQPELDAVSVPMLVVQGVNDRFGMPRPAGTREVVAVKGDHGLKGDRAALQDAVRDWLSRLIR